MFEYYVSERFAFRCYVLLLLVFLTVCVERFAFERSAFDLLVSGLDVAVTFQKQQVQKHKS